MASSVKLVYFVRVISGGKKCERLKNDLKKKAQDTPKILRFPGAFGVHTSMLALKDAVLAGQVLFEIGSFIGS